VVAVGPAEWPESGNADSLRLCGNGWYMMPTASARTDLSALVYHLSRSRLWICLLLCVKSAKIFSEPFTAESCPAR